MKRLHAWLVIILIWCFMQAAWSEGTPDVRWIARLPGFTPIAETTLGQRTVLDFGFTDLEASHRRVVEGLRQRGWTVETRQDVDAAGEGPRHVYASRKGWTLRAAFRATPVANVLEVSFAPDENADSTTANTKVYNLDHATQTVPPSTEPLTFNGHDDRITISGNCAGLTLNGNNSEFDVRGALDRLTINGSNNVVHVHGRLRRVTANGNNNAVEAMGALGEVHDNGANNTIRGQ